MKTLRKLYQATIYGFIMFCLATCGCENYRASLLRSGGVILAKDIAQLEYWPWILASIVILVYIWLNTPPTKS